MCPPKIRMLKPNPKVMVLGEGPWRVADHVVEPHGWDCAPMKEAPRAHSLSTV